MKAGKTCRKSAKWLLAALAITAASCVHGYEFVLRRGGVCAAFDGRGRLVRLANENTGHDWAGGGDLWRLYFYRRTTPPGTPFARRFSAMYSDFDFLDMLHMPLFYNGAQYLTNGPLSKEPTFLIGCTLL